MDIFQEHYADIHAPGWQPRLAAQLRERGLATFSGIDGHTGLVAVVQRLMTVRAHRDAGPDGVAVITGTHAEGACIISTLAEQCPAALRVLSAQRAAIFGAAGGYLGAVVEPAGSGRTCIRLRLDDLAWFSANAADTVPLLRPVIANHMQTFQLRAGEGVLLSNTRWLHGRDSFAGRRTILRVLGDPLPSTGIIPGFPSPAAAMGTQTPRAA